MSNWKARTLPFAGRLTLTKLILAVLHQRHVHAVSWPVICTPKLDGGLGLRSSRVLNSLFCMKNCWQICTHPEKLWVQVVRSKYNCGNDLLPFVGRKANSSNFWKGLCSVWEPFRKGLVWRIGDGCSTNFWFDHWIPAIPKLISEADHFVPMQEINKHVADYVDQFGEWNLSSIEHLLPPDIFNVILGQSAPGLSPDKDVLAWKNAADGEFSLKKGYEFLCPVGVSSRQKVFKLLWNWRGPERIQTFLWRLAHNSLLTNDLRMHRGMTMDPLCPVCHDELETLIHAMRDCNVARSVWINIFNGRLHTNFFTMNWMLWLEWNLLQQGDILFAVALDAIWTMRNNVVFRNIDPNVSSLVVQIQARTSCINQAFSSPLKLNQGVVYNLLHSHISWTLPPTGAFKLNCDGAVVAGSGAACGGIIRDHHGSFVVAFSCKIGLCSVVQAELWAVYYGLKLAHDIRISGDLFVESDSVITVNFVSLVNYKHVFREANQVADVLAKRGLTLLEGI
uniref:Ribonuclease H protein At1g65750 family n=1 Tax=Cajanus cajan TaxID=3821 RepID=A0A151T7H9_CAJCA|nr:Putative ribonuclease H protein At1g65750 family [Cajanus cajan]